MAIYKEIVTKAIIGKGKKDFKNSYTIVPTDEPTTVLGCWVINHKFKGQASGGKIVIDGSYDVNIWYSYDADSKTSVVTKKIDYSEVVNIQTKEGSDLSSDTDIIVRVLKQPSCINVNIIDGDIKFDIEKELGIEIVGDTKVKISVEEDEEPWDTIIDEDVIKDVEAQIDENVNEDFVK